jgi:hypothetical protein
VDDGWTGSITGLTLTTTSATSSFKSMIEVGGGSGMTMAKANNVHYVDSSGTDQVGVLTAFYTTTESAFNIKGTTNSLALNNGASFAASTSTLPLQRSSDGAYAYTAISTSSYPTAAPTTYSPTIAVAAAASDDEVATWQAVGGVFLILSFLLLISTCVLGRLYFKKPSYDQTSSDQRVEIAGVSNMHSDKA